MLKVLQINVTANWGSTGKIAEQIGEAVIQKGGESYIAYGRYANKSASTIFKIGSKSTVILHYLLGRFFDHEGRSSVSATKKLVDYIRKTHPNIIHLHNIHDHWLNYEILFSVINELNIHVVWTFHDCWAFTGHCTHFVSVNCERWKTMCFDCPLSKWYSLDLSKRNYYHKKNIFTSVKSLTVVAVSQWISDLVEDSFLGSKPRKTIYNGVDINVFLPIKKTTTKKYPTVLFVSNGWSRAKGLYDIYSMRKKLDPNVKIIIVGLQKNLEKTVPHGIEVVNRTNSVKELVELYNQADVFVNPTYADTFPTVNLEALACGTPVITYRTGGSPEAIDEKTGIVVEQGDVNGLVNAIKIIFEKGKNMYSDKCRQRAETLFDKNKCYQNYVTLYEHILNQN